MPVHLPPLPSIAEMSEQEAVDVVGGRNDLLDTFARLSVVGALRSWLAEEQRPRVRRALEGRLEALSSQLRTELKNRAAQLVRGVC